MDNRVGNALASKAQTLPPSVQFAIVTCLPNLPYGATWGYASYEDVKERYEELKKDNNIICRRLKKSKTEYGFLVEVSLNYMIKTANAIQAGMFRQSDYDKAQKKMAEAIATFEKSAKSGNLAKFDRIGIYCTNSTANITIDGKSYPSYRVSLQTALSILGKYGYKVRTAKGYVPASSCCTPNGLRAVSEGLVISPTETGVFLAISK